jgi:hypothetical protein
MHDPVQSHVLLSLTSLVEFSEVVVKDGTSLPPDVTGKLATSLRYLADATTSPAPFAKRLIAQARNIAGRLEERG